MSTITYLIQSLRSDLDLVDDHEAFVSNRLKSDLNAYEYRVLDNILIPSVGKVTTTQVDHVVVSVYGIFVIETKAHSGKISGRIRDKTWTQQLYDGQFSVYNPFRQNYKHTKSLERLFGSHLKADLMSLVVFPSADRVEVDSKDDVGSITHIIERIKSFDAIIYTVEELKVIIELLAAHRIEGREAHRQHISDVKTLVRTAHAS